MRVTIASGIGSLLTVIAGHVRRSTTSRTGAPHHFCARILTGVVTDSGVERFFLALPLSLAASETYIEVTIDNDGRLHIVTADHRDIMPKPDNEQVGFDKPAISEDRTMVGWLALYPNCCTSYPIPLALAIYKNGTVVRTFGGGLPIWRWRFEADGKRVAFAQETVHGHLGVHFELRDIESGRVIAAHDGDPGPHAPQWIRDVAD